MGSYRAATTTDEGEDEELVNLLKQNAQLQAQTKELKEIVTKSLQDGKHVRWNKLPDHWKNDRDFIVAAIRGDRVDWHSLEDEWKADMKVACATVISKNPKHSEPVLWRDFPESVRAAAIQRPVFVLEALEHCKMDWKDVPDSLNITTKALLCSG